MSRSRLAPVRGPLPLPLASFALLALLTTGTSCRAFLDLEDPSPGAATMLEGTDCEHAISISIGLGDGPMIDARSTVGSGSRATAVTPACEGAPGSERIYAVTADEAGFLTARLSRSGTQFNSVLYSAITCASGIPGGDIQCADRRTSGGGSVQGGEIISFPMSARETRYIVVDGATESDEGDYELLIELTDGDDCGSPIPVVIEAGTPMTLLGDTSPKKHSDTCTPSNAGKDVVYAVRGPSEGGIQVEVRPMGFDVTLYLRKTCNDVSNLTCQDDGGVDDPEGIIVPDSFVSAEGEIFVWVDSAASTLSGELGGPYRLVLTPLDL